MSRSPRNMLIAAAGCVAALIALMALAYYPAQTGWLDKAALDGFRAVGRPGVNTIATHLAHACNPFPYALFAAALIAAATATRGLRIGAATGTFLLGANATSQILKPLLAHHRELWHTEFHIYNIGDASFPSGHATAAMSLALAAMMIVPRTYRPLTALVGGIATLGVSFSILILSWHFPSDVVGGYLVATAWGLATLAAVRYADERWPDPGTMRQTLPRPPSMVAIALLAAFGTAVAAGIALSRAHLLADFADRHTAFVAVASAMAVAVALLLAAVLALSSGRRSS